MPDEQLDQLLTDAKRLGLYMCPTGKAYMSEIRSRVRELIHVRGGDIRPHPKNPRRHPTAQVNAIRGVLDEMGIAGVLLVYVAGDGILTLIDGECRQSNFTELTWPCVVLDVTDQEAEYLLLTHDAIAGLADVDKDALAELLASVETSSESVGALMKQMAETAGLLKRDKVSEVDATNPPAELAAKWGTAAGQLWEIPSIQVPGGVHWVYCGDSTDSEHVANALQGRSPVLMVTDPPYGVEYDPTWRAGGALGGTVKASGKVLNDDRAEWTRAYELAGAQVAYVWHAGLFAHVVAENLQQAGFGLVAQIIWAKQHFVLSRGDYHWQHEPCWYAVRRGLTHHWQGARDQATVWNIANHNPFGASETEQTFGHGTQKPIECMARPIRNNTVEGDLVYDPFLGSGTSLVAAEQLGRVCSGLELSPEYLAVCLERASILGLEPRLANH